MAKKIIKFVIIFIITSLIVLTISFFKRTPILSLLTVQKKSLKQIDMFVVLGGGFRKGKMGISTKERLLTLIKKYKTYNQNIPILICEYPEGKKKMELFIEKRINLPINFIKSTYKYNSKYKGTENNIKEILSVAKSNNKIKNILIITSPYHQLRSCLILSRMKNKMKIEQKLNIDFMHPFDYGESLTSDNKRFLKLIIHEFGGILYEKFIN